MSQLKLGDGSVGTPLQVLCGLQAVFPFDSVVLFATLVDTTHDSIHRPRWLISGPSAHGGF